MIVVANSSEVEEDRFDVNYLSKRKRKASRDAYSSYVPQCKGEVPRVIEALQQLVQKEKELTEFERNLHVQKAAIEVREMEKMEHLAEEAKRLEMRREEMEAEVRQLREQVEHRESALRLEKESMKEASAKGGDVLSLNIGGEKRIEVCRSTLCTVPGSLLEAMFSGRWDQQLLRDQTGAIFINYSPSVFLPLVDWLRAKEDACADDLVEAPMPPCAPELYAQYMNMLNKFNLGELLVHGADVRCKRRCHVCNCVSGERVGKAILGAQVRLLTEPHGEIGTITGGYKNQVIVTWNKSGRLCTYKVKPLSRAELAWA